MRAIEGRFPDSIRWVAGLVGLTGSLVPVFDARAEASVSLLLFGSLEASPSVFVTTGAKVALDRIDRQGFVALGSVGGGRRREATLTRDKANAALVFGYQWVRDWGVVAAYAGPESSVEVVSGCGCVHVLPARFGLRLQGEVWARPSEDTLVTATLIIGTIRTSAWGRFSWGTRLWGAYFGPEVALYRDETGYGKWNLGLHATDFALGRVSLRISGGLQVASEREALAPYVGLTAWMPW